MSSALELAENGVVPDLMLRWGVRRRLAATLERLAAGGPEAAQERQRALLAELRAAPIALATEAANAQHYEVPAAFFDLMLGSRKKYSCCLWRAGDSLEDAEERMLELTAARAGIADGMRILDLGCGWGAFALWAAERYPLARVTAVSNSHGQRRYIAERARSRRLPNLEVVTADAARFEPHGRFDRIVSVEMFEHVRNVEALLARVARWLTPDGRLFVHVFSHREHAYTFDDDPSDWLAQEYFTGGMMPSDALYLNFQRDLAVVDRWVVDGTHYARTLRAWLERLDTRRERALEILAGDGGEDVAARRVQRWRMFLIACEEAFGYANGTEWRVSHYLFGPRR